MSKPIYQPRKVFVVCPACSGRRILPHRHLTNKRNSKPCRKCNEDGEVELQQVSAK